MNNAQLGKRLKEARLAKKMTQSDVVGTFITRNMLSQIESGAASPSLRTLEYLANTLELPIHYLVSQEEFSETIQTSINRKQNDESDFLKYKTAYIEGNYDYVIKQACALDAESLFYDERTALLARAYLKSVDKLIKNHDVKTAVAYASLAAKYGEVGIYCSREIRTEALLLLDKLSEFV